MKNRNLVVLTSLSLTTFALGACQNEARETVADNAVADNAHAEAVAEKPAATVASDTSPGKPSAPISMQYEVLGNPVVGAPVSINVTVSATGGQGPVSVRYDIPDRSALAFQQGQVERLVIGQKTENDTRQIAVVPQREGRLYVNVSAEIQTAGGLMIKSMAIPIQVGSAPNKPQVNGELVEGPNGETVISMPAKEN